MKQTNIKNILIWALVFVNLFFLTFYVIGLYRDIASKTQSLRDLSALLGKNGITVDVKNIRDGGVMPEYTISRDQESEHRLAEALLGHTSKTDQGGNIHVYTGESGEAVFRSGGEFNITLAPGAMMSGGDALKAAKDLLRDLKIETYSVTIVGEAGNETVSAVCAVDRRPVFDCRFVLVFKEGSLVSVSGKMASAVRQTEKETDMSSPATALMIFLNSVKSQAITSTRIMSVSTGYALVETAVPGAGYLQPVWRIDTDAGVYTINTVTRKTEQSIQ